MNVHLIVRSQRLFSILYPPFSDKIIFIYILLNIQSNKNINKISNSIFSLYICGSFLVCFSQNLLHILKKFLYFLFKMEEESSNGYVVNQPRRIVHNWALYNSETRLISLELLPMMRPTDETIFGAGFCWLRMMEVAGFVLMALTSLRSHMIVKGSPYTSIK